MEIGGDKKEGEKKSMKVNKGRTKSRKSKIKILLFKRKSDLEAYLEWEIKIKHLFACQNYTEDKKLN